MSNWFARLRQKSPSSNSSANGAFPIDPSVPVSPYATDRRYRLPDEAPPSPQPGFERTTSGTAALWRTDTVPFTEPQPKDHLCLPDAGNIINARVDGVSPLTVSNASTIYNAHDNDDDSSSLLFTTIIPQKPRHDDTVVTKPSSGVSPRSAQLSNATSPSRLSSTPGTDQTTPYSPSPPQTMSAATIVSPPSPVVTTHYGAQTTPGIAESRKSFWQEKAFPSGDTYAESPAGSDDSPLFTPPRTDVRTRTAWLEQAFTPSGGGNMESPTKLKPEVRLETQRAPPVNIEPCPMESCPPPTPLSPPQPLSTRKEREPPPEDLSSPGQAPEVLAWRIRDKSKDTHAWAYNIWYRQGLLEWCPPESSVTPTSNSTQNLPPFVASSVHPHRAVVDVPDDQGTLPVKASPLRFRPLLTHKQKENDRPKVSTVSSMGEVESSRTQTKNCSKDPTVGSYQQLRVKVLASKEDVEKPVLNEPVSSDVVITEKVKSETVECEKDSMDIVMNNGIKKQFTAVTTQSPSVSKVSDHPAQYLNTGNIVDVRQENHDSKKDAASFTDTAEEETVKQNDRPKVSTVSSMGEVESSRTQAKNCSKDPTVGSYQQLRVKVLASKEDVEKPVLIEPVSSDVVITEKVKSETVECEKDSMDIVMNNGIKKQFTAVTTQSPSVSKMSDHPAQYLNTGNEVDVRQENHDSKKDAASFTDTAEEETVKQNDRPKVSTVSSMGEVESSRTQAKNCSKDPTVGSYQQLRVKVLASKEDVEKPVLIEPVSSDVAITEKVKSETVECEKDSMDIVMNNGIKKQFTAVTTQSPSVSKVSDHPAQYLNTGNIVDVRQENHDSKKDAASFTDTAEDETVSPALIQGLSVSRVEPIQQHQDTQSQDLASMCGNDSQSVGASGSRQEPLTPLEKARRKRSASRAIAGHVRMVTSTRYTSFQKSRRAPILSLFGGPNPVGVDVEERPSVDSETQSSLPNSKGNQERGEAYQEFVSAYRNYSRDRTSPAHYATRIQALDRLNAAKVKNRVPPAPRRIDGV